MGDFAKIQLTNFFNEKIGWGIKFIGNIQKRLIAALAVGVGGYLAINYAPTFGPGAMILNSMNEAALFVYNRSIPRLLR